MQSKGPKTKQRLTAYSLLLPPVAVVMAGAIGWPVFWYVKSRADRGRRDSLDDA